MATEHRIARQRTLSRSLVVLGLLAFGCVLVATSCFGWVMWSPLNCWQYDVDIYSGRVRYKRYLLWIAVENRIEDSALTKALRRGDLNYAPEWHTALTGSPGVHHSPHYRYHSAIHQIEMLQMTWNASNFSKEAYRESAQHVLALWQRKQGDFEAGEYLENLYRLAAKHKDKQIDVRTLSLMTQ